MKNILLGISGSIAAYKSPELLRLLQQAGAHVKVILTQQGSQFVAPLTLQTLCAQHVYQRDDGDMQHIQLARWAEHILIAPASANIIAKLAQGLADDLLTTTCLATEAPLTLAPAMNPMMWRNTATQQNVAILKARGVEFLGPAEGDHACGETGLGRLLEPHEIVTHLITPGEGRLLKNHRVLITAGPTFEAIDPIRFLGNKSSGKMGYALAQAALAQGAIVTLISGPTALTPPNGVRFVQVTTASEMQNALIERMGEQDIFISAAAIADFHCVEYSAQKIKKRTGMDILTLEFKPNPDILAGIKEQYPSLFCVGFAAETEDLIANAIQKMKNKRLDLIIANLIHPDYGIEKEDNAVSVIDTTLTATDFPCENKKSLAVKLIVHIAESYFLKDKHLHNRIF